MSDQKKIIARECRHVTHVPARNNLPDLHLVKEKLHYEDGTTAPALKWIKDFKRPFWVAQQTTRSYKQKKETEYLDKLMKYETTETALRDNIAKALGKTNSNDHIKKLADSPYLYGSEISSLAIIKNIYSSKNKTHVTPYSVLSSDIETDMINGTTDPIIMTAVFNKDLFICTTNDFIGNIPNAESMFRNLCIKYISEFVDLTPYNITYMQADGSVELTRKTFEWIHSKQPDFLTYWNMDFDIPKILATLEKYNVDPTEILCDPSIPKPARICKYKQGMKKRRKDNGQEVPIDYADQWHSLNCTASFYVIDAMCSYRLLRLAQPKEEYGLDAVLNKNLGARKLKFKEAEGYVKDRWHIFMQTNYKIEYMVYALFDSLSMQLLDEKILDLRTKMPAYAGITPFSKCNSKPKIIADNLHFYALENGQVLNSVGESDSSSSGNSIESDEYETSDIDNDQDEETDNNSEHNPDVMNLRDWIIALPAHLVVPGLPLIKEDNQTCTKIRTMVYDSDCVSAYPTATSILNVSKITTKRELTNIYGIDEMLFRKQNINLFSGSVNALEYGKEMFGLPNIFELDTIFNIV